ncbi:unnamed protein product [Cyprideis torosa]|uniref:Uncharacterized protein n=1 Tax=Cyprideis torosa TaxID=163714 RepID=A0A7R8ZNC7_9CRUS|nr:unnamed protein product [Cyprideis torosa]CAG0897710.1 unnamed protein product [Cyprideis torosa]
MSVSFPIPSSLSHSVLLQKETKPILNVHTDVVKEKSSFCEYTPRQVPILKNEPRTSSLITETMADSNVSSTSSIQALIPTSGTLTSIPKQTPTPKTIRITTGSEGADVDVANMAPMTATPISTNPTSHSRTPVNPAYICEVCGRGYRRKGFYLRHLSAVHAAGSKTNQIGANETFPK